jgi:LuxR family maltose regulon positive regulatory protein
VWLRSYRHGLARMYWMAGDADGYRRVLPFLVAPRTIEEWPFTETAADVARGQAAILEENWRSAIAPLTRATRTYPQQRMAAIYCDPRVSLAYAHLNLGERETARTVFAPVLGEVLEQRAVGLLLLDSRKVVTALLDNLAVETRRSPAIVALRQTLDQWTTAPATSTPAAATPAGPLATLSDREQEVLAQVAAGASNKHIARDLSLSLHTVKRHVANILDKLDCASRGQAADLFRRLS